MHLGQRRIGSRSLLRGLLDSTNLAAIFDSVVSRLSMTRSTLLFPPLLSSGLLSLALLQGCGAASDQVSSEDDASFRDASTSSTMADGSMMDAAPPREASSEADRVDALPDGGKARSTLDAGASPELSLRFPDPAATLPRGEMQRAQFCATRRDDPVGDVFCGERAPRVTSLSELLVLLGVDAREHAGARGAAISGHSTSLSKRSVSAINPRVIFMQLESTARPLLAVAFTRGDTLVEIVTRSRSSRELQFYAVAFTLSCSESEHGCSPGDLLTPAIEQDWQSVDAYHEDDLENTAIDCRVCHQPSGDGTPKLLRMQELELPWTHWFDEQTRGGRALLADYYAAHGDEPLAGIPAYYVSYARGSLAAAFVRLGGTMLQPNEFRSLEIEIEVERDAPEQPASNRVRGRSETWKPLYEAAQRAEAIPVPYHDVKITDPSKVAAMQHAYTEYRAGRLPRSALPDIRDVLPDDPNVLADMGVTLDERLDDRALLTAACGLCHNQRLDQTLTRARFHLDLERLTPEQKQSAIDRLNLPGDDPLAMPPRRIHEMGDRARARLVALLRQ
jgi:hypothetical protein